MDQNQVIPIGGVVPEASTPAVIPIGGVVPEPMFKSENALDEAGHSVVRQSGGFLAQASGVPAIAEKFSSALGELKSINPLEFNRFVQSAFWHPIQTLSGVYQGRKSLSDAALKAFHDGDYVKGAAKAIEWLTPFVGERLSQAGDLMQAGDYTRGAAATLDAVLPIVGPKALEGVMSRVPSAAAPARAGGLTPAEAASNAFAEQRGIPLDAATATGSRTARAAQKLVGNTLAGESTAKAAIRGQQEALGRVGGELAEEVRPGAVTAEQAGQGVSDSIRNTITALHEKANQAYGTVREAEAQTVGQVPKVETPAVLAARKARQQATLRGATLTEAETNELRNIRDELEAQPYQSGKLVQDEPGVASGTHYTRRVGNADVYKDIGQASGSNEPAGRMIKSIDSAIETGQFTSLSRGALDVARKRLAGDRGVSSGFSKPGTRTAGAAEETQAMNLPIDLRLAKETLGPMYERLKREGELAPLMGGKADALRALDRLINGPDHAPLSIADGALSDLKAMSRSKTVPELRGAGKGTAAYAAQQLDGAINMALESTSPKTQAALQRGRAATRAKYQAGDVLDLLERGRAEPVATFKALTAPGDSGIKLLRKVQQLAPESMPELGRAWLEQRLDLAGDIQGGFGHADALWRDWTKLGRETKRVLFQDAGQAEALNHFFLLAKRLSENPNPSGTAHTLAAGAQLMAVGAFPLAAIKAQIGAYALSKLLYTPKGVAALQRVMRSGGLPTPGAVVAAGAKTAQAAAYVDLVAAAKSAGVPLPLAADREPQR